MREIQRSAVGRSLGEGAFKQAYVYKPDPSKVIVIAHRWEMNLGNQLLSLRYEVKRLEKLKKLGFPIIEPTEIVKVHGRHRSYYGMIMPRLVVSTNDHSARGEALQLKTLNEKSIRDAKRLIKMSDKNHIDVHDFQCLVKANGGLIVHDPMKITKSNPLSIRNELKDLIALSKFCIACRRGEVRRYFDCSIRYQAIAWASDSQ